LQSTNSRLSWQYCPSLLLVGFARENWFLLLWLKNWQWKNRLVTRTGCSIIIVDQTTTKWWSISCWHIILGVVLQCKVVSRAAREIEMFFESKCGNNTLMMVVIYFQIWYQQYKSCDSSASIRSSQYYMSITESTSRRTLWIFKTICGNEFKIKLVFI
jgi:hypothetical protein